MGSFCRNFLQEIFVSSRDGLPFEKVRSGGVRYGSDRSGFYRRVSSISCTKDIGRQSREGRLFNVMCHDGELSLWSCFRAKCGRRGCVLASADDGRFTSSIIDLNVQDDLHGGHREHKAPIELLHEIMTSHTNTTSAVSSQDGEAMEVDRLDVLKLKLEKEGIHHNSLVPGKYTCILCPKCRGGKKMDRGFSLFIHEDLEFAMWRCFRGECGWRGHVQASSMRNKNHALVTRTVKVNNYKTIIKKCETFAKQDSREVSADGTKTNTTNGKSYRVVREKGLRLEPLCDKLIGYLSERMISLRTLRRNGVMKRAFKEQIFIAFPYRRNGMLVGCKYRSIEKKFWQERQTESIFYGLDDIKKASFIIIVEGEIDKLSMEEAGYQNCISVPNGAPQKASKKESLNEEQDSKHRYLDNCKENLKQASHIILATDSDRPGQALAEDLAQRVGMERCQRVRWPKRNEFDVCKDANEVLVYLGPNALRDLIENAEPWVQSNFAEAMAKTKPVDSNGLNE